MNEIGIIDKSTGEILPSNQWEAVILDPEIDPENLIINLNKKGTRFSAKNIHLRMSQEQVEGEKLDEPCSEVHPLYGKFIDLYDHRKKFTKVYHRHEPQLTNLTYGAYWLKLTMRLTKDTNIIYMIEDKKIRFAHSRQDLMEICKAKQAKFYMFYRECLEKSFIAEFRTDKLIYIVNPHYALNGNKIPEVLYNLFNKPLEEYQEDYEENM